MVKEIAITRKLPANIEKSDLELFEESLNTSFYVLSPLILNQVSIIQDTVFSPKDRKVYSNHTHTQGLSFLPIAKRFTYSALKKWRKIPHGIWVKDEWSNNFFHWMTDCLPRIWQGLEFGISNTVILHDSFRHLSYVTESLELLAVQPVYFTSRENLWVNKLVLTSRTSTFPNFNIPYTVKTRERMAFSFSSPPSRKIYASRRYAKKRKSHNEVDVELLAIKKGYEVVYFEKLSLAEQIKMMAHTKVLVALHGAALTNMLFMQKNQKVVELRNIDDKKTNCYFNLASALGQQYFYTLNQGDSKNSIVSDFTINLKALEEILEEIERIS